MFSFCKYINSCEQQSYASLKSSVNFNNFFEKTFAYEKYFHYLCHIKKKK